MLLFGTQRINDRGHLEVGGCDTVDLAEEFGTPLYVFDEEALEQRCVDFRKAFHEQAPDSVVAFAAKAFLCRAMARIAHAAGLHLDVASLGELKTVAAAQVPMKGVTFHGNYKKDEDILGGLDLQVGLFAIDSRDEARRLSELAAERGLRQRCVLRVAPGIDAHTLDAISTGRNDTKFGVTVETGAALEAVKECLDLPGIELAGLHCHIGSQVLTLEPFELTAVKMMQFASNVKNACGWFPEFLVLGGGLGIHYREDDTPPAVKDLAAVISKAVRREAEKHGVPVPRIGAEPGRSIVGELGLTLYRVGPIKTVPLGNGETRTYLTVDGGLSDNPRPLMYGSPYPVLLANRAGGSTENGGRDVRISGRHCETDTLFPSVALPSPESGDVVAVLSTGAYNHNMASNYNLFFRPPVVFVKSGIARIVVRRETIDDLLARDMG